jgi:hypothetical protein
MVKYCPPCWKKLVESKPEFQEALRAHPGPKRVRLDSPKKKKRKIKRRVKPVVKPKVVRRVKRA